MQLPSVIGNISMLTPELRDRIRTFLSLDAFTN